MYLISPRHVYIFRNIVVVEFKVIALKEMLNVLQVSGNQVIHGNDMVSFADKTVAQMRTEKTGLLR